MIGHLVGWFALIQNEWHKQDEFCFHCHQLIDNPQTGVHLEAAQRRMVSASGRVWWRDVAGGTVCSKACLEEGLMSGEIRYGVAEGKEAQE